MVLDVFFCSQICSQVILGEVCCDGREWVISGWFKDRKMCDFDIWQSVSEAS